MPKTTSLSARDRARITEEVDAAVLGYLSAIESLDLDRMLDFWADVDGFTFAGDGTLVVGYGPWAEQIRTVVATMEAVSNVQRSNPHVYVLAEDAASYSMEYGWTMTSKEGETVNAKGSWTYVFVRFPDRWRVVQSAGTHIYS